MIARVLQAGALGGLIMFAWSAVSWMVLPWHEASLEKFSNEPVVARDLTWYAKSEGIYILPNTYKYLDELSAAEKAEAMTQGMQRLKQGPFIFVSVSRAGIDPEDPAPYINGILINIIVASLISYLVLRAGLPGFAARWSMVAVIGVIIAIMSTLPMWNWWHFPLLYTLVNFADMVVATIIGGLVIAWRTAPRT